MDSALRAACTLRLRAVQAMSQQARIWMAHAKNTCAQQFSCAGKVATVALIMLKAKGAILKMKQSNADLQATLCSACLSYCLLASLQVTSQAACTEANIPKLILQGQSRTFHNSCNSTIISKTDGWRVNPPITDS